MRHGMANKKLNRTSEHRKALLKNMLNSLIKYEQITTTLPKAKFLKPQADKIITLGKKETLLTTKMLMTKLQDIASTRKVTKTLSKRYEKRNGGYTRIIKAGFRYGNT
jgi:large subunit ribosomal protein L17